jgi:hypothetical protein
VVDVPQKSDLKVSAVGINELRGTWKTLVFNPVLGIPAFPSAVLRFEVIILFLQIEEKKV